MKKLRYFLMMFLTAAVCAGFQSCSDDDEEDGGTTFSNFYIECTNVSGGGLSAQDCVSLRSDLNTDLVQITNVTQSEAIEIFDDGMKEMARELSSFQFAEPLKVTFELKIKGNGKSVKRAIITITSSGATVS